MVQLGLWTVHLIGGGQQIKPRGRAYISMLLCMNTGIIKGVLDTVTALSTMECTSLISQTATNCMNITIVKLTAFACAYVVPNFVKKESGSILRGKGSWWLGHTHFCRNHTPFNFSFHSRYQC